MMLRGFHTPQKSLLIVRHFIAKTKTLTNFLQEMPFCTTEEEERNFLNLKNNEPLETRFMFFDLKLK